MQADVFEMELIVVVNLFFLLCICNGYVFGSSTQSSVEVATKKTEIFCLRSDINLFKSDMHELLKSVNNIEREILSLK